LARAAALGLCFPLLLASSCSGAGDNGSDGAGSSATVSLSPVPNTGPPLSVEAARTHVLSKDTTPEGLKLQRTKKSDPTPGAEQGWNGGWTTESLVGSPGQQKQGWEWAQSSVNVYRDATSAANAFQVTKDYVVSAYSGNSIQADPGIGDESVAVEATQNVPDVTVVWRDNNSVLYLSGYGGKPLTNGGIIALAKQLNGAGPSSTG
jgi:hypothetical protein